MLKGFIVLYYKKNHSLSSDTLILSKEKAWNLQLPALEPKKVWDLPIIVPILIGILICLITSRENYLLFMAALAGFIMFFSIKHPELALAMLFNGVFIYLYSVFKLGVETSRIMTGSFYGFLAICYILGGILFIIKSPHEFKFMLIMKRPQKLKFMSIDILFFSFFCLVILSYFIFYKGEELAYIKITYAPLLVIVPYFGIRLLVSKEKIGDFLKYCVIWAAILIIPAFYELIFNPTFREYGRFSMYMFSGSGDNPILFGITFSTLMLILFVWMFEQRKLILKYFVFIIPSMFLLLRSGSRGAIISFLVSILFYIFFMLKSKLKIKIYALFTIALLIFITYKFIPEATKQFYDYTFSLEALEEPMSSIQQRIDLFKSTTKEFIDNPIMGVGIGNSVYGIGFPHNILLETSAELGVFGLSILLLMFYLTIRKALSFIKKEEKIDLKILMKISLSLFIYSLAESMYSGYLTNQTQLFLSMGLIASLIEFKSRKKEINVEPKKSF
ncbi:MAG: O-antigen ligase family protein [Candidatus Hodarchaeota archaeon]